jgi:hypothetical protein
MQVVVWHDLALISITCGTKATAVPWLATFCLAGIAFEWGTWSVNLLSYQAGIAVESCLELQHVKLVAGTSDNLLVCCGGVLVVSGPAVPRFRTKRYQRVPKRNSIGSFRGHVPTVCSTKSVPFVDAVFRKRVPAT